uniref:Uncharacterized protein n=1 Tax=Arundo donax TaxID=35708 RepID=A0A0A9F9L9_ARUDO
MLCGSDECIGSGSQVQFCSFCIDWFKKVLCGLSRACYHAQLCTMIVLDEIMYHKLYYWFPKETIQVC